jgi:hypothetical protein
MPSAWRCIRITSPEDKNGNMTVDILHMAASEGPFDENEVLLQTSPNDCSKSNSSWAGKPYKNDSVAWMANCGVGLLRYAVT